MSNQQTDVRALDRLCARRVRLDGKVIVLPPEGHGEAWGTGR